MSFIGVISKDKEFESLKNVILKNINQDNMNIININKQSIHNIQNVKFEIIIITCCLEKLKEEKEELEKICKSSKYLIVNSDINLKVEILIDEKLNIITYGLNQKSTVTLSSISEEGILVSLQRNIQNNFGELVELEEKFFKLKENTKLKTYDILIIYIISTIYNIE